MRTTLPVRDSTWTFRIGDLLPSSDPTARFITVLAAALNDLLFVNGLLVGPDDTRSDGERQYLLRTAISHLWEFSLMLAEWRDHDAVQPLIEGLGEDALGDLKVVLCLATPGDDPVLKTFVHLRNAATWHYAGPKNQKWIEKALAAAADHEGDFQFGSTIGSIRAGFADEVLIQFALQTFSPGNEEAELAAFRLLCERAAGLQTAAIRVAHDLLAVFFENRTGVLDCG